MHVASDTRQRLIREELRRVDGQDPLGGQSVVKHVKMAADPYRFLRGAAQLFYADIKSGLLALPAPLVDGVPLTAILGDCHLSNFGFMTEEGSHGDQVVFAPNDFDDACIGPAAWDLARFCVSLFLAADHGRGILAGRYPSEEVDDPEDLRAPGQEDTLRAARAFLRVYRRTCAAIVADPERRMHAVEGFRKGHVLAKPLKKARKRAAGGKDFESKSSLGKAVEYASGRPGFRNRPDRYKRLQVARANAVCTAFRPYVYDAVLDIVQRVGAGTGSVNVARYYLLVGPDDFQGPDDLPLCHVVEVKQQRAAAPLYHFPQLSPVNRLNPAHLTLDCQRLMQRRADLVLDEVFWEGAHWLVRSRHHARVGIDPEDVVLDRRRPGRRLKQYAKSCAEALALAHARGDRRSTRFEAAVVDCLAANQDALLAATRAYARQAIEDWGLLREMLAQAK